MATSTLLEGFEGLSHTQRFKRMVDHGQQSKELPSVKSSIDALASSSIYEQALGLQSCYGSHDMSIAVQLLHSPSKHLKKRAINIISLLGSNEEALQALQSVPEYLQISTIRRMRQLRRGRKRLKVIDMFLETLNGSSENKSLFRKLFFFGSADLVQCHLDEFQDDLLDQDWGQLIKYHPKIARDAILAWASRAEQNDSQLCDMIEAQFPTWLEYPRGTEYVFGLVKSLIAKVAINHFPITKLILRHPEEMVQIILDCEDDLPESVVSDLGVKYLQKLDNGLFVKLFKRYPGIATEQNFTELLPKQRLHVYQEIGLGWRDIGGVLEVLIVAALPQKERMQEARRHLKLRTFEANPNCKIPYVAMLPWDEAIILQKPFIQDSDADTRGTALREQIAAAKWDETRLPDAMQLVLQRKNEQDPIKKEMMIGLEQIPVGRWKGTHLESLAQIIINTLSTSDASRSTINSLLDIVANLTPAFPDWCKVQLKAIMRAHDEIPSWSRPTGKAPVRDTICVFAEALKPIVGKKLANNDVLGIWSFARTFGKHTKYWEDILDTCERSMESEEVASWRGSMVSILKEHRPHTWHSIVPRLIALDGEVSGLSALLEHVHLHQQGLLTEYYLRTPNTWKKEALNSLKTGFWRWTDEQQAALAQILVEEIEDEDTTDAEKKRAINQLSLLTFTSTDLLTTLANDFSSPALQELSLRALGRLDDSRSVPTLISALSDSRARIAIYALKGTLQSMSKPAVFALLESVPKDKITVRKETLRLIGDLGTEEAFSYLLAVSKEEGEIHRDIHLALLRSLWLFLDREETWEVLRDAALSQEASIAKAVLDIPVTTLSEVEKQKFLHLIHALLSHTQTPVRIHALARCAELKPADPNHTLACRLLELIDLDASTLEVEAAAKCIFALYNQLPHTDVITELYNEHLLPSPALMRMVHDDVFLVTASPDDSDRASRPATRAILEVLKQDRLSVSRRVKTMFSALPWMELRPWFKDVVPELHTDALVIACEFLEAETAGGGWDVESKARWRRSRDVEDLREMEGLLRGAGGERDGLYGVKGRRLGLSMLIGIVQERGKGWMVGDREILDLYRGDEDPGIAEGAWAEALGPVEEEIEEESEEEGEDDEEEKDGDNENGDKVEGDENENDNATKEEDKQRDVA